MEFHEFLRRFYVTKVARSILIIWLVAAIYAVTINAMVELAKSVSPTLQLAFGVIFFLSLLAAALLAIISTFGLIKYENPNLVNKSLLKLWIFPFIGSVFYLARKSSNK